MAIDTESKIKSAASSRGGFRGGFIAIADSGDTALEATSQEILAAVAAMPEILAIVTDMQKNSVEAF